MTRHHDSNERNAAASGLQGGRVRPVGVLGAGCAVPEGRLSAGAFEEMAVRLCAGTDRERGLVSAVVRRSGITERGISVSVGLDGAASFYTRGEKGSRGPSTAERMEEFERLAPALASAAGRKALAEAAAAPGAITHLVTASCTGFSSPGVDLRLLEDLGLSADTARVHVGFMGCHGAVNACRAGRALALESPQVRVLVVVVELCALHFQYGMGRDELLPNTLFADGAAALVLGQEAGGGGGLELLGTASRVIPQSAGAMTWRIGNTGFRMTLDSRVPDLIGAHAGGFVREALAEHGLAPEDVAGWAIHPGGPRVVESVLGALGLPNEAGDAARTVLRRRGNMSSATLLFVLEELLRRGTRGPVGALAFGPGLTAEFALFRAR